MTRACTAESHCECLCGVPAASCLLSTTLYTDTSPVCLDLDGSVSVPHEHYQRVNGWQSVELSVRAPTVTSRSRRSDRGDVSARGHRRDRRGRPQEPVHRLLLRTDVVRVAEPFRPQGAESFRLEAATPRSTLGPERFHRPARLDSNTRGGAPFGSSDARPVPRPWPGSARARPSRGGLHSSAEGVGRAPG